MNIGEPPPQLWLVFLAQQYDIANFRPTDEPPDPVVGRFDPGGTPCVDDGVVEPDGCSVEGQRWFALARLSPPGDDPDVLDGAAAEHPAEVQLTGSRVR